MFDNERAPSPWYHDQTEMLVGLALRGHPIDDPEAEQYLDYTSGRAKMASPRWVAMVNQGKHGRLRSLRMAAARAKGTHCKSEWTAMVDVFGGCVRCGVDKESLYGGMPSKDHIIPIFVGGCDCIANIQPLCRNCNSGKPDATDYRPIVRSDWAMRYIARLENGWE